MNYSCTRVNYNGIGSRFVHSVSDVVNLCDERILLVCSIKDFFVSVNDLSKNINKDIRYNVIFSLDDIDDDMVFDYFLELGKYVKYIDSLELTLVNKLNDYNFIGLVKFLYKVKDEFNLVINIGNIDILSRRQINMLNNINDNILCKFKINQSYSGLSRENNDYDNIYNCHELIDIKNKVYDICSLIPFYYDDKEKILFVYKYLGERVFYDDYVASLNYEYRNYYDSRSIYDVLFNNKGVCSSIAVTFRIIMNSLGVYCYTDSSLDHEWNVLKIDNSFYKVDLTSDLYNIKYDFLLENFLVSQDNCISSEDVLKKIKK